MRAAILGNLIGRMAKPASELSTWHWLQKRSALGELIDVDYDGMSHMILYRASDALMRHRSAIEEHLFGTIQTLFGLEETVTLYDLTNTYFEGAAEANPKANRSSSRRKSAKTAKRFGCIAIPQAVKPKKRRCWQSLRRDSRRVCKRSSMACASPAPRNGTTGYWNG